MDKTNPSAGAIHPGFLNIAFTSLGKDLGKAANATGDWGDVETTASKIRSKPGGEDAKLKELVGWIRGKFNAPPESISLIAKKFQTRQEHPSWNTMREAPSELTKEGDSKTRLHAQELMDVSPASQDGRYSASHYAQWGVNAKMGLFETQDCFDGPPHYRVIDIGDAIRLHEKAYKSTGSVTREKSSLPFCTYAWH